ncbi:MAG: LpqN/LpqT family lipoprotein [Acidimicrobiales bacterium]
MMETTRNWRALTAGVAVSVAAVLGSAGPLASADPVFPQPPVPVPSPVTQPIAVSPGMPAASPQAAAVAPVQPTLVPATSGSLRDYFQAKGVKLAPQKPQGFDALDITLPVPSGWTQVPDPNVPDAFAVIANRSGDVLYTPNAQVVVYKLIGDFDPKEAITHGYNDARQLMAWRTTSASLADFGGFPSSIIEGTYRQNEMTLNTSRRHVIATSGSDRYLVSLAVNTSVASSVAEAPATDAVVNGFQVTNPAAASAHAPASAPAPLSAPAPSSAPAPPMPGLPALPALPVLLPSPQS